MGTDASALLGATVGALHAGLHFVVQESCKSLEGIQKRAISGAL